MRKGFTLVELLVVTLVIAILAGIVFRLKGVSKNSDEMQKTVRKMQRLENCLSGYYAAFGSYPPVEVQGSRNPFIPVNEYGIQQMDMTPDYGSLKWECVDAACKSQPLAMKMPYNRETGCNADGIDMVQRASENVRELIRSNPQFAPLANGPLAQPFDMGSPGALSGKKNKVKWTDVQIFQFGLMSFLLPRYLLMLGVKDTDKAGYCTFAQWGTKNNFPCKFDSGVQYSSWDEVNEAARTDNPERYKVSLIPSQAVSQRWIANLEKTCKCGNLNDTKDELPNELFVHGVNIKAEGQEGSGGPDAGSPEHLLKMIHSAGDSQSGEHASYTQQYVLNQITVTDSFNAENDLYYYSPPPYQTYRLWSAGPNGKTFPPWIPDEQIRDDPNLQRHAKKIYEWISDDVVHLSH